MIVAGLLAGVGTIFLYNIIQKVQASKGFPLIGLTCMITTILALIFLGDVLTIKKILGIVFACIAIVMLV